MEELRKRLDQLKPVVEIDGLYDDGLPDIGSIIVASMPTPLAR